MDITVLEFGACCTPKFHWKLAGCLYSVLFRPVILAALIGNVAAVPVARESLGLIISTGIGVLTCRLNGMFGPALYMSLPWIRSYMMPIPPRTTVLPPPVRS